MEKFEITGIWKGEYAYDDRYDVAMVKSAVPFIVKIKSIDATGLFEGMCQDDPAISHIDFPADIFGKLNGKELTFSKRYPKTVFRNEAGNYSTSDQPHPGIIYQATLSNNSRIFGSWKIERTFLKITGKVVEYGPATGLWWMERM